MVPRTVQRCAANAVVVIARESTPRQMAAYCKARLCPCPVFVLFRPVIDGKPGRSHRRRTRSFPVCVARLTAEPSAPGCRRSPVFFCYLQGTADGERVRSPARSYPPTSRGEQGKSAHCDRMKSRSRQDLFLRSRISANTFHAGLPASPTDFATSGTSARRNGFAAFSAPMVDG